MTRLKDTRPPKPVVEWDDEDGNWIVKVSENITVRFLGKKVLVTGSLVDMRMIYDRITEERGIEFRYSREDLEIKGGDLNDE